MRDRTYAARIVRLDKGPTGQFAICHCPELDGGSCTFSRKVFEGDEEPQVGWEVLLSDVRSSTSGWRAYKAQRLFLGRVIRLIEAVPAKMRVSAPCAQVMTKDRMRRFIKVPLVSPVWQEGTTPALRDALELTQVEWHSGAWWAFSASFVRPPRQFR